MTQRFIIRLLDAADRLLGWAEIYATAKPQERPAASCPFHAPSATFQIEQAGRAVKMSIHWVDLDVARVQNILEPVDVVEGQTAVFAWLEPVWLVGGMRDVPLPPVTVRTPVTVAVPVGGIGVMSPG